MIPRGQRGTWTLAGIGLALALVVGLWAVWGDRHDRDDQPEPAPHTTVSGDEASQPTVRPASTGGSDPVPIASSGSQIRGQIHDPEHGPLTEGRLDVVCQAGVVHASTPIDEAGEFVAPACASGPSCLRLTHPSLEQPAAWEFDASEADRAVELETAAAARRLGSVRGPAGAPVANAELLVQVGEATTFASSDAAGEFVLTHVRARPCDRCDGADHSGCRSEPAPASVTATVLISASGYAPLRRDLVLGDPEPIELTLSAPAAPITGRVTGSDGEPFDERTRVIAHNRAHPDERHAASVDADGRFAFDGLGEAEYSLRAIRDERELAVVELARPGEQVALRSELDARGPGLTVEIVDAAGQPVSGARVDGGPFRAVTSDTAGRVHAGNVAPGRYTLRVRSSSCPRVREAIELEPTTDAWLRRVQLSEQC